MDAYFLFFYICQQTPMERLRPTSHLSNEQVLSVYQKPVDTNKALHCTGWDVQYHEHDILNFFYIQYVAGNTK